MLQLDIQMNSKSITKALRELKKYRKNFLNKVTLFTKRLAEEGLKVAEARVGGNGDAGAVSFTIEYDFAENVSSAKLIVTSAPHTGSNGKVFYPHLAWEFGAGIYYNDGNANPKASEFGMGVNTFNPEHGVAVNPGYWYYTGDDGMTHLSLGTEATMPMYNASLEIIRKCNTIAREVFSDG